jgi:hypothetical protein
VPRKTLAELRVDFRRKKDMLEENVGAFSTQAEKYPRDEVMTPTFRMYASYAAILKDVYQYMEELFEDNEELRRRVSGMEK